MLAVQNSVPLGGFVQRHVLLLHESPTLSLLFVGPLLPGLVIRQLEEPTFGGIGYVIKTHLINS